MNSSNKGDLVELWVLAKYIEQGYEVAIPFGNQKSWDLLVYEGNKWQKIQVKTVRLRGKYKDRVFISFYRSKDRRLGLSGKSWTSQGYSKGEIDYIVGVEHKSQKMWKLPALAIIGKGSITFGEKSHRWN